MPVSREKWPYLQVADGIAARITAGDSGYREGDRLPVLQEIAAEWRVSHETAHRAVALLRSRKLVTTIPRTGSFVGAPREVPGPQQMLSGMRWPAADQVTVTAAEHIPAPEYVVPILGVTPYGPGGAAWVIRREQVLSGAMLPVPVLAVSWFPGVFAEPVPELLSMAPLAPGETAKLIARRTGRQATAWAVSFETRQILDDGREGPLTGLDPDAYVQAVTYTWADKQSVIEYGEYVLGPGLVTTAGGILEAPADNAGNPG
jgi:DNA-binding transcriptional regulator YhcF (GntR family)